MVEDPTGSRRRSGLEVSASDAGLERIPVNGGGGAGSPSLTPAGPNGPPERTPPPPGTGRHTASSSFRRHGQGQGPAAAPSPKTPGPGAGDPSSAQTRALTSPGAPPPDEAPPIPTPEPLPSPPPVAPIAAAAPTSGVPRREASSAVLPDRFRLLRPATTRFFTGGPADGSTPGSSPPRAPGPLAQITTDSDVLANAIQTARTGNVADSSLALAALARFKGADRAEDVGRQLATWRLAVTSDKPVPRFSLQNTLGEGAQGIIFRVSDLDCRRDIALKTFHQADCNVSEVSRFIHEAQITAQLEHPGIVPVHDFGVLPQGTVYYTMKRVDGESLASHLVTRAGKTAYRFELLDLFLKVCDTIGFAHSRGVVHRDIKPRNIMVGPYGEVLVMDWGLAKVMGSKRNTSSVSSVRSDSGSDADIHKTLDGFAVGTPAYMSPEQARGESGAVDPRSDIYALGVMLYEMLCGQSPYERGDVRRTLEQVATGQGMPLERVPLVDETPRGLCAIVRKAMALAKVDRYVDVASLARDIRRYLIGEAVSAHRETILERALRLYRLRRTPIRAASAVAAMAVLLALAAVSLGWLRRGRELAEEQSAADRLIASKDYATAQQHIGVILNQRPLDPAANRSLRLIDLGVADENRLEHQRELRARAQTLRQQADGLLGSTRTADLQHASELYLNALGLDPNDPALRIAYQGVVQRLSDAASIRQRRRERDQAHRNAQDLRAEAEKVLSDPVTDPLVRTKRAVGLVQAAIQLYPDAATSLRLEQLIGQEQALEQAAQNQRRRAEADHCLADAVTAAAAGNARAASASFDQAQGLDPADPALPAVGRKVQAAVRRDRERSALALLVQARSAMEQADHDRHLLEGITQKSHALSMALLEEGRTDVRPALFDLEQNARSLGSERATALAQAIDQLEQANTIAPGFAPIRAALTDYFVARLQEDERKGDPFEAAAALAQAKAFDDRNLDVLAGIAVVTLAGDGPVRLHVLTPSPDGRDIPTGPTLTLASGSDLRLPFGRYLAVNPSGITEAFRFERGRRYQIDLPSAPAIPPGTAFLPAGTVYGPEGTHTVSVQAFAMGLREVTAGEYIAFLNDGAVHRRYDQALAHGSLILAPRDAAYAVQPLWRQKGIPGWRKASGDFVLESGPRDHNVDIDPASPVSGISYDDAMAYARWRAARDHVAWRLPTTEEWQLAAQGGDGRAYPWGDHPDLSMCYSPLTAARVRGGVLLPGGSFPADRSVQGVCDLAGSLSEFVDGGAVPGSTFCLVMGGNFLDHQVEHFSSFYRREVDRRWVDLACGFRLAVSVTPAQGLR